MIDFNKEEFLAKLDVRLMTMASMLAYHEKWIVNNYLPNEKAKIYHKDIDKALEFFNTCLKDVDKKIQEYFHKVMEKYENGNA